MQLNAKLRATDVKLHINTAWSNSTVCQCVMQATSGVSCFYSILHIGKSAAVQASTSLHNDRQIRLAAKQFCGVNAGKNASQRTSEFVSEGTCEAPADPGVEVAGVGALVDAILVPSPASHAWRSFDVTSRRSQ